MTDKPKNFNVLALRGLAKDLAVADPRWAPTVQLLRDAADELEHYQELHEYYQDLQGDWAFESMNGE